MVQQQIQSLLGLAVLVVSLCQLHKQVVTAEIGCMGLQQSDLLCGIGAHDIHGDDGFVQNLLGAVQVPGSLHQLESLFPAAQVSEVSNCQGAVGHVVGGLQTDGLFEQSCSLSILALVVQQAAQQEGSLHGVLCTDRLQHPHFSQTGRIGVGDLSGIGQGDGCGAVTALLVMQGS